MKDAIVFTGTALISGYIGHRIAHRHKLQRLRYVLFELTVVSASLVLVLVFWEMLELGSIYFRGILWKWLIFILLCLLGFIYPLFHLDTCVPVFIRAKSSLYFIWISAGYAIYITALMWLSAHLPIAGSQSQISSSEWIRLQLLASNALIGITMMAVLCGISSVIAPYTAFLVHDTVNDLQAQQISSSVANTEELIAEEELRLSKLDLEIRGRFRKSTTNLVGRIFGRGDEISQRRDECQAELGALHRLLHELRNDKEDIEQRLKSKQFNATLVGRLVYYVYCIFAIYCVYRLCNGYRRMVWYMLSRPSQGESGPRDALVTQIASWLHAQYPSYTVDNLTRMIAIFMSGIVICTSMNGVFQTLRKMQRRMRPNILTDPLLISHVFGIYVIACATILRLNIPKNMSGAIITALKFPLEVSAVQLWNDLIFCGTSTIVISSLFLLHREKERPYDEEMEKYD